MRKASRVGEASVCFCFVATKRELVMNRAERRRNRASQTATKAQAVTRTPQASPTGTWKTVFDAAPMADGMPPHFLLYVLNEKEGFVRYGKLVTATLWLQSQMVALVCLNEDAELRKLKDVEHGRHLPGALRAATTNKLEDLSSEPLRREFLRCFDSQLTQSLRNDLDRVFLDRDGLSHGYVSLFSQIMGPGAVTWAPRSSPSRDAVLSKVVGEPREGTVLALSLTADAFEEIIARICRIMDFIASVLKKWDIPYAVFA